MKSKIIIITLITIFLTVFMWQTVPQVYAADSLDEIMEGADGFIEAGQGKSQLDEDKLEATSDMVFNTLLAIAIVIAVIVGMIIGIQFMVAGVEEKAKIKEALLPYVISCVVVFGAFGIWKLVVNILNQTQA